MKTKSTFLFVLQYMSICVSGATLCSGNSPEIGIDQTIGSRVARVSETIRFSSAWESSNVGAVAEVAVNGVVVKTASGTGTVDWSPTRNGTYTLTHKVMVAGSPIGEILSAIFIVTSFPDETQTTEVPVPFSWLREKYPNLTEPATFEAKANELAANGRDKIWECYVSDVDPTNSLSKFVASIMMVEGKPVITWSPDLNEGAGKVGARVYTIQGSTDLKEWEEVVDGDEGDFNFFKVKVSMP